MVQRFVEGEHAVSYTVQPEWVEFKEHFKNNKTARSGLYGAPKQVQFPLSEVMRFRMQVLNINLRSACSDHCDGRSSTSSVQQAMVLSFWRGNGSRTNLTPSVDLEMCSSSTSKC